MVYNKIWNASLFSIFTAYVGILRHNFTNRDVALCALSGAVIRHVTIKREGKKIQAPYINTDQLNFLEKVNENRLTFIIIFIISRIYLFGVCVCVRARVFVRKDVYIRLVRPRRNGWSHVFIKKNNINLLSNYM